MVVGGALGGGGPRNLNNLDDVVARRHGEEGEASARVGDRPADVAGRPRSSAPAGQRTGRFVAGPTRLPPVPDTFTIGTGLT